MIIRWLPEAVADLDRIDAYRRAIEPDLAQRAAAVILDMAERLNDQADRGRPSRAEPLSRELIGRFGAGAFILRYRASENEFLVVQVRHSREDR